MGEETLVIGNGFDLQCGLKSKYSDFYNDRYFEKLDEEFEKYSSNPNEFGVYLKIDDGLIGSFK